METGLQEAGVLQGGKLFAEEHVQRLPPDGHRPGQFWIQELPPTDLDLARPHVADGLQRHLPRAVHVRHGPLQQVNSFKCLIALKGGSCELLSCLWDLVGEGKFAHL